MRWKLVCVVALAVVVAVTLTSVPIPAATQKSHYVGFVPPALTSPFHVAMAEGAKKAAEALGWKLEVQAPGSEGDVATLVTLVQQLLAMGVEAVSINPILVEGVSAAIKSANEKHVPILAHNFITPLPAEGTIAAYIGYDQWNGAKALAKVTCGLLARKYKTTADKTGGKVFILTGIDGLHAHRRTGGFKAGLAESCPNVKVVGEQSGEWLRTKGQEVATIALQKDSGIDVFYGNSDEMAIGAGLAGEQLGRKLNEDFFTVGIDGNPPTLDLLKDGKAISATLGVFPADMGVTVVKVMEKILNGEKVPEVFLTPSVVVTKDNLADYTAGKLWTEPVAGQLELDNGLPTGETAATPEATASK